MVGLQLMIILFLIISVFYLFFLHKITKNVTNVHYNLLSCATNSLKHKDIQFIFIFGKEKQQILTFKKM